jgi:hypothetical protein
MTGPTLTTPREELRVEDWFRDTVRLLAAMYRVPPAMLVPCKHEPDRDRPWSCGNCRQHLGVFWPDPDRSVR